jgi:quercetin dioxygenase-like cupin family protein
VSRAAIARADRSPRIAWIGGSVHTVCLAGPATEGRLTVLRSSMRGPAASPVHVHPEEDETVAVLDGRAVFWAGRDRFEAAAGDTVFLPRGLAHTYRITSETADLITICTPAGMERFFRAAGWDLSRGPVPDGWAVAPADLQAAALAGGQQVLGPPLALDEDMPESYLSGG